MNQRYNPLAVVALLCLSVFLAVVGLLTLVIMVVN